MKTPFSAIITPESVSFTSPDGRVTNVDSSHKNWTAVLDTIRELQKAERAGLDVDVFHETLTDLVGAGDAKMINAAGAGRVSVVQGVVQYDGEPVHSAITERIIWGLSEGFDMLPYMKFLDNAMDNPSARAVDEMYGFMEHHNMGITEDGYILGYKKIRENYTDIWSGSIDNSPGQTVRMRRNAVDDNPARTCSKGLHFCSMAYLPHFGNARGNRIVIVKVNPRDIVSVPLDYNHAKVRCCEYTVLSEYNGSDKEDLLGSKAVWEDDDFDEYDADDIFHEDEDDFDQPEPENEGDEIVSSMRELIDIVEEPLPTEEGEVMRELIDVVVENSDPLPQETPVTEAQINSIITETELSTDQKIDAIRKLILSYTKGGNAGPGVATE